MGNDFSSWVFLPAPSLQAPTQTEESDRSETTGTPGRITARHSSLGPQAPGAPPPPADNRCRHIEADFSTTPDGRLCIFFPFKGMAKSTAKTFFESGFFEIREPFALPDHIAAQLAPEANPVITAGYYPVAVSETGYTVIF